MQIKFLLLVTIPFLFLAACSSEAPKIAFDDVPAEGDAGNGEKIFAQSLNNAPPCSSCHNLGTTNQAGPGMEGYGERAGSRVDDESDREYTYWSIVNPTRHVVSGFSNVMYDKYDEVLSPEDIADLIAYLLEL
jgi:mono/diheme cytochrome c family protein